MTYRDNAPHGWDSLPSPRAPLPATDDEMQEYVLRLIHCDWADPNSPMHTRSDVPLAELAPAWFYDESRFFLRLLTDLGQVPLTATGSLNQATVRLLAERLDHPRESLVALDGIKARRIIELDIPQLNYIHLVCRMAGLVHHRRLRATATHKAIKLIGDQHAGELYCLLFTTFFRRLSLGYVGRENNVGLVQDSSAVILWRLQLTASDWLPREAIPREVLLPSALGQIVPNVREYSTVGQILERIVLEPLNWFGLLERDPKERRHTPLNAPVHYRRTPLFDRFLAFRL